MPRGCEATRLGTRFGQIWQIRYRTLRIAPRAGEIRSSPYVAAVAFASLAMPASLPVHARGFLPLLRSSLAVAAAGSLLLSGCSATKEAVKNTAMGAGEAARTAASGAAQQALGPAVTPVLDLLRQGEADLKAGNLGAAVTAMGGFQALWEKAGPVIQPLAGDKWGAIDTAAKAVVSTFGNGAKPDAAAAGSAITGLMGPLSALVGQ